MNLYLDASALVKCFVTEIGSADVRAVMDAAIASHERGGWVKV